MATQSSSKGGECSQYLTNKEPVSSVLLTLPITCQICLGKVKDPVICPNQHVFCGVCMTQWLNSNQICPTCRIPINESQPCKRIIGSLDCSHPSPDRDIKEQLRRTRFELLFQEYEGEIATLESQLEETVTDNKRLNNNILDLSKKLEESEERFLRAVNAGNNAKEKVNGDAVSTDINTILKLSSKLQDLIQFNHRLKEENNSLKEEVKSLQLEKTRLNDQVKKVVEENSFPKSPQKYGKYTLAAMQTKLDNYEKEIQRLKRALDRSDEYIDQLNSELRDERGRSIDVRNPAVSEHGSKEGDQSESGGLQCTPHVHASTHVSNGHPPFSARRQINLSVGKSPLNHVATAAFTPSSGAFIAVEKENLPNLSVTCNGNVSVTTSLHTEKTAANAASLSTTESESRRPELPLVFPAPAVALNASDSPVDTCETDGSADGFADPVRFPACAKLIQLTKAHRMLSNNISNKPHSGELSQGLSTSSETTTATASSATTVVVSPRNNLVDLLLQPRENARKNREKGNDSPNRNGQPGNMHKEYRSLTQATDREHDTSVSPVNGNKTPSPPALIPTLGESSGGYDSNLKSPGLDRSPPPLSFCGAFKSVGQSSFSEPTVVTTAAMKNDPNDESKLMLEQSQDRNDFTAFTLSPKRIKIEPED